MDWKAWLSTNPIKRRRFPSDPFFEEGNMEREIIAKQLSLDINDISDYEEGAAETSNT